MHFRKPRGVELCTGSGLGGIELGEQEKLYCASVDVKNAFYNIALPEPLRDLFCLKPLRAEVLGITEIDNVPVQRHQLIYPQLTVLPMGFSWALYYAQRVHRAILSRAGFVDECFITDTNHAVRRGNVVGTILYVDNVVVVGTNETEVNDKIRAANEALLGAGLPTHELSMASTTSSVLGWEFENGT
eukprot:6481883-Amphidinium_carterae.1